jgi:predicted dehydrogenase
MSGRKITLIGCGGWGSRIAEKLALMGHERLVLVDEVERNVAPLAAGLDCEWSSDPLGYLGVTGTQSSSIDGGVVIIATPPESHLATARAVFNGYGVPPTHLRIEKPIAASVEDARAIIELCKQHGTQLTVGFTLLHHPLYEAAFDYLRAARMEAVSVSGVRVGRRARHRSAALIDIGVHTASIGAYLGVPVSCAASYSDSVQQRVTSIRCTHGEVIVDELEGVVHTPDGVLVAPVDADALHRDLAAWISGTHRGTPVVALCAQETIMRELAAVAA